MGIIDPCADGCPCAEGTLEEDDAEVEPPELLFCECSASNCNLEEPCASGCRCCTDPGDGPCCECLDECHSDMGIIDPCADGCPCAEGTLEEEDPDSSSAFVPLLTLTVAAVMFPQII